MIGGDQDQPASLRLAAVLRQRIADGTLPAGSRLPSYRQLRDEHGVALNTAQAAVRLLAVEGLAEIRPARGAYVSLGAAGAERPLSAELTDLRAALARARQELAAAERAAATLASRLGGENPR